MADNAKSTKNVEDLDFGKLSEEQFANNYNRHRRETLVGRIIKGMLLSLGTILCVEGVKFAWRKLTSPSTSVAEVVPIQGGGRKAS